MTFSIFSRFIPFLAQTWTVQGELKADERAEITSPAIRTENRPNDGFETIPHTPSTARAVADGDEVLRQLQTQIDGLSIKEETGQASSEQKPSIMSPPRARTGNEFTGGYRNLIIEVGRPKPFTLDSQHAQMLLLERRYFIVYPNIYMFEKNRIVCRITDQNQYQAVESVVPNPPLQQTYFYLDNMLYWFDQYNELWYNLSGQWYTEVLHLTLESARAELVRCAANNQIPSPASTLVASPSTSVITSLSSMSHTMQQDLGSDDDFLYPPFASSSPNKEEVDRWFEEFKTRRAALQKTRERVPEIRCPVQGCGKQQRRPQALRDHLYFHFDIKPYMCTYGCSLAFETEANRNRHLDSCAFQPRAYH